MYQSPGMMQGYPSQPQRPVNQGNDNVPAQVRQAYPPQTANGVQHSQYPSFPSPASNPGNTGQWTTGQTSAAQPPSSYQTPFAPQFQTRSPVKQPFIPTASPTGTTNFPTAGLNGNPPPAAAPNQHASHIPSQQQPPFNSHPQSPPNFNHVQNVQHQQGFQEQFPQQQPMPYNGFQQRHGPAPPAQNYPQNRGQYQQDARSPQYNGVNQMTEQFGGMSVNKSWNQMWNQKSVNLMTERNIRNSSSEATTPEEEDNSCCDRDVMRPTLSKVPESSSLLQKARLPFGIMLHPFKDDNELPIIQDRTIVRCRTCRTYINPFVRLLEQRRWQCNLCNRVNDLPDDFLIDFQTKRYMEYPPRQPELLCGSVEFIAPVEYMVRPPQPAAYIFVFDCSAHAYHLGYIPVLAKAILDHLDMIPGDSRTLIGFIGFDSKVHFFSFDEKQASHLLVPDIEDVFLPNPDNLLVNLRSRKEIIEQFLTEMLPNFPMNESTESSIPLDTGSALGPALSVAHKIIAPIGGRITVFQATLPNLGAEGSKLENREDPNIRGTETKSALLTPLLNPSTDFYKKLALECSEQQVAVDLFCLSPSYCDLASVSQVSKISGGSIFYYGQSNGNLSNSKPRVLARLEDDLGHYLTRSIGFEAVLRIRCTRGLSIHSFHGNCFVRSTDLLTLPNVNPDSGYAVQISIEDDLRDFNAICFQAAVLYTNASGERRIRVHTLALPVVGTIQDVISGADSEAIVGLLSKMAVDRSRQTNIADAREAVTNAVVDLLGTYKQLYPAEACAGLVISTNTRLLPLYVLALLKNPAFRVGVSTKIDERVAAMEKMKNLPLPDLINYVYPDLYPVHGEIDYMNEKWPQTLHLSFANFERNGVYLLDTFESMYLYICKSVNPQWLSDVFGVTQWHQIPDDGDPSRNSSINKNITSDYCNAIVPLPDLDNQTSVGLRTFIDFLIDSRPFRPHFFILREDSSLRRNFLQYLHDDRDESAFSYYEFLQHLQQQIKN